MSDVASWVAPIATTIAAVMTAANLGARITGWGFVIFTVGSVGWSMVAITTGQPNLLWTNGFLTLVNAVGIWRWLGRQARYYDGAKATAARSAAARVPSLFSIGMITAAPLLGRGGNPIGAVVDGMMRCGDTQLAYLVVSEGGVGGVGERLHALHPDELRFSEHGVSCDLAADDLAQRPLLEPTLWPAKLDPHPSLSTRPVA